LTHQDISEWPRLAPQRIAATRKAGCSEQISKTLQSFRVHTPTLSALITDHQDAFIGNGELLDLATLRTGLVSERLFQVAKFLQNYVDHIAFRHGIGIGLRSSAWR
jgi:hypothetical protein